MGRRISRLALIALGCAFLPARAQSRFDAPLSALEQKHGGRLGVAVAYPARDGLAGHRQNERFAMASTFKLLLVGAILARVDDGRESLDRLVKYDADDVLEYAPVTSKHIGGGMTVGDLCAAAIGCSDNTAANLLLDSLGGPAELTAWLRSIGDDVTRLDRVEPELNSNLPGDERDTSTPAAFATTMRKLLLGETLSETSRDHLTEWLLACTTGGARLRAGFGKSWKVGDKTGTGENGAANDVAIVWPPGRGAPLLVVVFYSGSKADGDERSAVIAEVGRWIRAANSPTIAR